MRKILIVEDEMPIAELEKDYLELSDFEVTIENDGNEGAKKAMTGEYDLLILDLMLPGKDGFEICREYREKFLAPVIMVSAKKEDIDKILQALYNDRYIEIDNIRRQKIPLNEEERRFGIRY